MSHKREPGVPIECGLMFSNLMLAQLLEGKKTQTRRTRGLEEHSKKGRLTRAQLVGHKFHLWREVTIDGEVKEVEMGKPITAFFLPGDLMYVKEPFTYRPESTGGKAGIIRYKRDNSAYIGTTRNLHRVAQEEVDKWPEPKWAPAMFMAARMALIWRRITDVRIQRLHDITPEDAVAEGMFERIAETYRVVYGHKKTAFDMRLTAKHYEIRHGLHPMVAEFAAFWNLLNGREAWQQNPLVWVYSFEPL